MMVPFLLFSIAGIGAGAGTVYPSVWYLTPLALSLLILLVWHTPSSYKAALYGGVFGFLSAGISLIWIWDLVPTVSTAPSFWTLLTIGLFWLLPTVALGAISSLFALGIHVTRENYFAGILVIPLFLIHEELRMWAWTLVTYGNGALVGPHFSATAFGYVFTENSYLLQLAEGGGLIFLSLGVSSIAISVALCIRSVRERRIRIDALIVFIFTFCLLWFPLIQKSTPAHTGETLRIALFSKQGTILETKSFVEEPAPDVLIFPEGLSLSALVDDPETLATMWNTKNEVLTISSTALTKPVQGEVHFNTLTYTSSKKGVLATQDKIFLMPEGEYLPYLSELFLMFFPHTGVPMTETPLTRGTTLTTVPFKGAVFGTLLCSEVLSPHLYRTLVKEYGATVLVNLSSISLFEGSPMLHHKAMQMAKMHAVQNRRYAFSAQTSAPSYVIDPRGNVVAESSWGRTEVLFFDLPVPSDTSD